MSEFIFSSQHKLDWAAICADERYTHTNIHTSCLYMIDHDHFTSRSIYHMYSYRLLLLRRLPSLYALCQTLLLPLLSYQLQRLHLVNGVRRKTRRQASRLPFSRRQHHAARADVERHALLTARSRPPTRRPAIWSHAADHSIRLSEGSRFITRFRVLFSADQKAGHTDRPTDRYFIDNT